MISASRDVSAGCFLSPIQCVLFYSNCVFVCLLKFHLLCSATSPFGRWSVRIDHYWVWSKRDWIWLRHLDVSLFHHYCIHSTLLLFCSSDGFRFSKVCSILNELFASHQESKPIKMDRHADLPVPIVPFFCCRLCSGLLVTHCPFCRVRTTSVSYALWTQQRIPVS